MIELLIGGSLLAMAVTTVILAVRINKLSGALQQVRMATYDITQALDGDIKDLRTSLARADIPLATEQRDERVRRFMLSPEEREREDVERWDARVEDLWG